MEQIPGFLESELGLQKADDSLFHVIPVPLEASVSYGSGAAMGPKAILTASQQLETWDGLSCPMELGIHTTQPVDCSGDIEPVLFRIQSQVAKTLSMGALPVTLGGEHSVTLGVLRALRARTSDPFGIIQFDAHADLRDEYEGNRFSHACVMKRAFDELNISIFQIGVRAISHEEHKLRSDCGIGFLDAHTLFDQGIPDSILPPDFPKKIYITFDVDCLDPSIVRATGTPVPGGIGWYDSLKLIKNSLQKRTVLGFDVVELAPTAHDHASDFAAAQLAYSIMGIIQRHRTN
jgi:agmatinase